MKDTGTPFLKPLLTAAAALVCVYAPLAVRAQGGTGVDSGLVNISTPDILAPHTLGFRADSRIFGGDENTTYLGAGIRYGLSNSWELDLGTSLAQFDSFNLPGGGTVRHGGSDLEVSGKYAVKQTGKSAISGEVGLALPNTPAQKSAHLTLGMAASLNVGSGIQLYTNPRVAFITDNTIVGLGVGAKAKLARQISFVVDYTPILAGANTIDIGSGTQRSHDVYGAAVRFDANHGSVSVDLGWTNGTGFTTGSSLTPGLGNSSAFYVTLNFKR